MSIEQQTQRKRMLTDSDAEAIAQHLHELHVCRFHNIEPEEMSFMKDLLSLYKETRSEVIKWVVRGIVYGALILVFIASYFKLKSH